MRYLSLAPGEVAIKASRLAELEAKAKAHDAYVRATQRMRQRSHRLGNPSFDFRSGYKRALQEFSELVVEEGWQ